MDKLVLFNNATRNKLLNKRSGESKFGQHVKILTSISNIYEQLKNLDVTYVILGLPEDIGVFANYGKTGTSKAWEATLKVLLNIQSNKFTKAESVLILGHLDFSDELIAIKKLNPERKKDIVKSRTIVDSIDKYVTHIIYQIVLAGKKPIIIGGGHNNSYGNIKGSSLATGTPINVINLDAHSDFRTEEGRHSGNGFSYALTEGFLQDYFIFGLHENYTSDKIFKALDKLECIKYNTFEALEIRNELKFKKELNLALEFVSKSKFGIEIDCDAIEGVSSSAMSPSGFSATKARSFLSFFAKHNNTLYLHICEAIPSKKSPQQVGKLISYLITDFIKA
ncbi:formimidoylglutamase [Tamlana sp. 2201CG12-4]|uniref:formimidoylglutamase n=1 Tax=Tamlana sp. 2201CG12-4 TaxID=3112582 RepID=UPI002DB9F1A4|nr:formimidoylglutamase [Tamlana sp. 2201CG12-4]MEC3907974.1 formimidoylglutamase [Tamlana sp. 2201CG12-4]